MIADRLTDYVNQEKEQSLLFDQLMLQFMGKAPSDSPMLGILQNN